MLPSAYRRPLRNLQYVENCSVSLEGLRETLNVCPAYRRPSHILLSMEELYSGNNSAGDILSVNDFYMEKYIQEILLFKKREMWEYRIIMDIGKKQF